MKYLIDTQVLLWIFGDRNRLPKAVSEVIIDPSNDILVSYASFWEISIKMSLGKIDLPIDLSEFIVEVRENQIKFLPIEIDHILGVRNLPFFHGDPFDRLIISQSLSESLILISSDEKFKDYGIKLLWK